MAVLLLATRDTATTVRVRHGERLLSDAPSIGIEHFIAGIDVVSCADRQQAIQLAAAHPMAKPRELQARPPVTVRPQPTVRSVLKRAARTYHHFPLHIIG
jgi:hypothetical protein